MKTKNVIQFSIFFICGISFLAIIVLFLASPNIPLSLIKVRDYPVSEGLVDIKTFKVDQDLITNMGLTVAVVSGMTSLVVIVTGIFSVFSAISERKKIQDIIISYEHKATELDSKYSDISSKMDNHANSIADKDKEIKLMFNKMISSDNFYNKLLEIKLSMANQSLTNFSETIHSLYPKKPNSSNRLIDELIRAILEFVNLDLIAFDLFRQNDPNELSSTINTLLQQNSNFEYIKYLLEQKQIMIDYISDYKNKKEINDMLLIAIGKFENRIESVFRN